MYNNNPTFRTTNFAFYLNPDGGQSNINCDPMKGDFNTLVIRRNPPGRMTDEEFQDQYRNINFFNEFSIRLEAHDLNPKAPVSQIRELSERAVIELLQVITERP
jgi:hypothetical protein